MTETPLCEDGSCSRRHLVWQVNLNIILIMPVSECMAVCHSLYTRWAYAKSPGTRIQHTPAFISLLFTLTSPTTWRPSMMLRFPERIRSRVVVLVYKVLHGCAPSYLGPFTHVADLPSRRGLRSSCSNCLVQTPVHRSTVGSRTFSVAGP